MIAIGRVFSTSFAMLRQRFWLLLGMWAVFFAIQIAALVVMAVVMVAVGVAGMAGVDAGLEDPSALAGMGVGVIVLMLLFYAGYIVILLAQQAAMVTLASPLEEPAFGAAMARGFRSAVPFFAITLVLLAGYFALVLVLTGLIGLSAGDGGGFGGILSLLFLPVLAYLACRFSVLVPVVAVEQVFRPFAALGRCWALTRGKAFGILLALLGFAAMALVVVGVLFVVLTGGEMAGLEAPETAAGFAVAGLLMILPALILIAMFAAAFTAALHGEVSGGGADALEQVFA